MHIIRFPKFTHIHSFNVHIYILHLLGVETLQVKVVFKGKCVVATMPRNRVSVILKRIAPLDNKESWLSSPGE
jgi:hypothetical protein